MGSLNINIVLKNLYLIFCLLLPSNPMADHAFSSIFTNLIQGFLKLDDILLVVDRVLCICSQKLTKNYFWFGNYSHFSENAENPHLGAYFWSLSTQIHEYSRIFKNYSFIIFIQKSALVTLHKLAQFIRNPKWHGTEPGNNYNL